MKISEIFLFNIYSKTCLTVPHIKNTDFFFNLTFSLSLAITCNFAKIKYENKENCIADELKILRHWEDYNHILLEADSIAVSKHSPISGILHNSTPQTYCTCLTFCETKHVWQVLCGWIKILGLPGPFPKVSPCSYWFVSVNWTHHRRK